MTEINVDLSIRTKQTITDVYNVAKKAVESGKPIIFYGMNLQGMKVAPIWAEGWYDTDQEIYLFNASNWKFSISQDDRILVTDITEVE